MVDSGWGCACLYCALAFLCLLPVCMCMPVPPAVPTCPWLRGGWRRRMGGDGTAYLLCALLPCHALCCLVFFPCLYQLPTTSLPVCARGREETCVCICVYGQACCLSGPDGLFSLLSQHVCGGCSNGIQYAVALLCVCGQDIETFCGYLVVSLYTWCIGMLPKQDHAHFVHFSARWWRQGGALCQLQALFFCHDPRCDASLPVC